jgi:SAM-dependent methyltransferase
MPEEGGHATPETTDLPGGLPDEAVTWGFRLLAGREPMNPAEFLAFKSLPDLPAMRRAFAEVPDFQGFASSVLSGFPSYSLPLFMLRQPRVSGLDWRFEPPALDQPTSQLCTAAQLEAPELAEMARAMRLGRAPTRATWEQAWIIAVLRAEGLLGAGRSALMLDARRERIASFLAAQGVAICATGRGVDTPDEAEARRTRLFYNEMLPAAEFDRLVRFRPLDVREIGGMAPGEFDACFSFGLPGRLGSVAEALDVIEASLAPLKPGGLALHLVGFNLSSDGPTRELPGLVLLRRGDIEALAARLAAAGHEILPLNTHPGTSRADEELRIEQAGQPGLRQVHGAMVGTSFGLAIRKAGGTRRVAPRAVAAPPPPDPGPQAMPPPATVQGQPGLVSAEAVVWAMRFFLDREPADAAEIAFHRQHDSLESLRTAFIRSTEFDAVYGAARAQPRRYATPRFLMAPPSDPALAWRFEPPTMENPVCQFPTASQFREPVFTEILDAFAQRGVLHRKLWEAVLVASVLSGEGMIGPGRRGLGFGVGRERIPALLASRGVEVLATDAPAALLAAQGGTPSYPDRVLDVFYPEILPIEDFERLVGFAELDMNAIPAELAGAFDFCWSVAAMHHLGSIDHGLAFVENSLATLKPGGIAVHTAEFNLTSDEATVDTPRLSVFRRQDIERLAARLRAEGHEVMPLNTHPGHEPEDEAVDLPPFGLPHLKLQLGGFTITAIGLILRKRG